MNIWWGILNLLPILPLDGGRITNEALNICHPRGALQISLWVSLVVATAMAATGLSDAAGRLVPGSVVRIAGLLEFSDALGILGRPARMMRPARDAPSVVIR